MPTLGNLINCPTYSVSLKNFPKMKSFQNTVVFHQGFSFPGFLVMRLYLKIDIGFTNTKNVT